MISQIPTPLFLRSEIMLQTLLPHDLDHLHPHNLSTCQLNVGDGAGTTHALTVTE